MNIDDFIIFLFLGVLGFLFFLLGILLRLGHWRWIFAMKGHSVLTPSSLALVFVPIGLLTMFLGFVPMLPLSKEIRLNLGIYLFIPLVVVTFISAILQPNWLKPIWLRWLEKEHGDIIHLLWEDVREDRWGWERRVKTQKDLETWVNEVRRKHGLE